ncbi:hypothetical protein F5Y01DRAFT_291238 [Xylaria sp. FL0043]|nr:hypothetical protein F5Y01DRAFT_291238 [Xylaria sp. FL0043]
MVSARLIGDIQCLLLAVRPGTTSSTSLHQHTICCPVIITNFPRYQPRLRVIKEIEEVKRQGKGRKADRVEESKPEKEDKKEEESRRLALLIARKAPECMNML